MIQSMTQLPLGVRIPALRDAVVACRNRKAQDEKEEAEFMDMLAKAESEVTGHAAGSEGVELSGLIAEGENPYTPKPAHDEPHHATHHGHGKHAAD